jgi:methionyl-tRNA formyltransferase
MKLDEGMDTGPTFARLSTAIGPEETAGEVAERLSRLGATAVHDWLGRYVSGQCTLEPQDSSRASLAPMLTKEHGLIDWGQTAKRVHDHVRGMRPWPGAYTSGRGGIVGVHATRVIDGVRPTSPPGAVVVADKARVIVACGHESFLELVTVQPRGRRAVRATEWVMGRGVTEGDILGLPQATASASR